MNASSFSQYAWAVGLSMPLILAAIGGLVWAFMNWNKASTAAMAAAGACGVLMLFSCIFPAVSVWGPRMIITPNAGINAFERMMWFSRTLVASQSLCWALCVGALVFAVFAGRAAEAKKNKDKKKRTRDDDDDDEDDRPRSKSRKDDDDRPRKRSSRDDDDD
jgi:hypothetical protein